MKKKISLPMQILIALILGIVVGFACYAMQPLSPSGEPPPDPSKRGT